MSIVRMKRIKIIAMTRDRPALFEGLMRLGTVEITEATEHLKEQEWADVTAPEESETAEVKAQAAEINAALDTLNQYVPEKRSIFAPRPTISIDDLFDTHSIQAALDAAGEINEIARKIPEGHAEENRLNSRRAALEPWKNFELPLDISSTKDTSVILGVCPTAVPVERLQGSLEKGAPMSELFLISSDREYNYLLFICYKTDIDAAMDILKRAGFSRASFKHSEGTASQIIKTIDDELENIRSERENLIQKIKSHADSRETLFFTADRLDQRFAAEQARERIIATDKTFLLEGWTIGSEVENLAELLDGYDCWYELTEPDENDEVPIKLQSNKFTEPFNMVTEMFSLPQYTNIDPNPVMGPFFAMFFGIMYGGVAYGIILLILGSVITAKYKLRGVLGQMFRLMKIVGVTTILFGFVYGSFFGDSISTVAKTFFGMPETYEFKIHIGGVPVFGALDLLADPITALILACSIGAIQIVTGMGIKAYILCRDGRPLDALMDVGCWWVTFAGIALFVLGHGYIVLVCGIAALILTQGRRKKNIAGKITGGLSSLYSIIQYVSDILSYSRLMALALASSVIAIVFNLLASLAGGPSFLGVIVFILVFLLGHVFNMGVNIISTYVHGARLQYLEYFNRFYVGGGEPFQPLTVNTRFTDIIIKEEK